MELTQKTAKTYEVKIYIGSSYGYGKETFTREQLLRAIEHFQCMEDALHHVVVSLRVTDCTYAVKLYQEDGWEIAAINYPRFPKDKAVVVKYMEELLKTLMYEFKQNRMTMVLDDISITYEAKNAQDSPFDELD